MGNLIKYEFRKTLFVKLILLALTGAAELVFLIGVFYNADSPGAAVGVTLLTLLAIAGITFIGIHSMLSLYRDLNTKQSYMLFMTPHSSYTILGAKIIENGLSILAAGAFFALLAFIDLQILLKEFFTFKAILEYFQGFLEFANLPVDISASTVLLFFLSVLTSWLATIVTAHLAIILSATFLAGKRFSGVVSFVLFIAISLVSSWLVNRIPDTVALNTHILLACVISLLFAAVCYLLSGWMAEKKLSV